jgi:hypothetical protein
MYLIKSRIQYNRNMHVCYLTASLGSKILGYTNLKSNIKPEIYFAIQLAGICLPIIPLTKLV